MNSELVWQAERLRVARSIYNNKRMRLRLFALPRRPHTRHCLRSPWLSTTRVKNRVDSSTCSSVYLPLALASAPLPRAHLTMRASQPLRLLHPLHPHVCNLSSSDSSTCCTHTSASIHASVRHAIQHTRPVAAWSGGRRDQALPPCLHPSASLQLIRGWHARCSSMVKQGGIKPGGNANTVSKRHVSAHSPASMAMTRGRTSCPPPSPSVSGLETPPPSSSRTVRPGKPQVPRIDIGDGDEGEGAQGEEGRKEGAEREAGTATSQATWLNRTTVSPSLQRGCLREGGWV